MVFIKRFLPLLTAAIGCANHAPLPDEHMCEEGKGAFTPVVPLVV